MVTLYFEVLDRRLRRPGTAQNTSLGEPDPMFPASFPLFMPESKRNTKFRLHEYVHHIVHSEQNILLLLLLLLFWQSKVWTQDVRIILPESCQLEGKIQFHNAHKLTVLEGRSLHCFLGVFEVPPHTQHGVELNLQVWLWIIGTPSEMPPNVCVS